MSSGSRIYDGDTDGDIDTDMELDDNINITIHDLNESDIINRQNRLLIRRGGVLPMAYNKINILLVGCGGREHAYYSSLKNSNRLGKVYCYTGQQSGTNGKGIRNPAIPANYIILSLIHISEPTRPY